MKTNIIKELHTKDTEELKKLLTEKRQALFSLRIDHAQNKLKNTKSLFITRKEIAAILTVLNGKEQEVHGTNA